MNDNHWREYSLPYLYNLNRKPINTFPIDGYHYDITEKVYVIDKTVKIILNFTQQIDYDWFVIVDFNDVYTDSYNKENPNVIIVREVPKVLYHKYKYRNIYHITFKLFIKNEYYFEKVVKVEF